MGYYNLEPGMPIEVVLARWVQGHKAYNDSMPQWYSPKALWPYREFTWTRDTARDGTQAWDALVATMAKGWDSNEPLHLKVGKNGVASVGEGNHRLSIAKAAGLKKIPVQFHFYQSVEARKVAMNNKQLARDLVALAEKLAADDNDPEAEAAMKVSQQLADIRHDMKQLWAKASKLVRQLKKTSYAQEANQAETYWLAMLEHALGSEYGGKSSVTTMMDTINALDIRHADDES